MEALNDTLFLWLNAPLHPDAWILALAVFLANWLIWMIPIAIGVGWLYGTAGTRRAMIVAAFAGSLGLLINQGIALAWMHPRPFMIGIGHTFVEHAPDSSFPSDHLTLWWAVAFSFCMHERFRKLGGILALLGLSVAWARIYLGVHFPFDMLGSVVVAVLCAWVTQAQEHRYLDVVYKFALALHRRLFGVLINRGWLRP